MSSLVTEDNKRERSGSDDSNWSTEAIHDGQVQTIKSTREKDAERFQAVWMEANDEEKKLIREIIEMGGMIIGKDVGAMSLYEKWKMLRKYATKEEKEKIMKIWYRTEEGKWSYRRKQVRQKRKKARKKEGLRF